MKTTGLAGILAVTTSTSSTVTAYQGYPAQSTVPLSKEKVEFLSHSGTAATPHDAMERLAKHECPPRVAGFSPCTREDGYANRASGAGDLRAANNHDFRLTDTAPGTLLEGQLVPDPKFSSRVVNNPLLYCRLPAHSTENTTLNHDQKINLLTILAHRIHTLALQSGFKAEISWRIKSSDSALGKLLMEALAIDRNNPVIIKNKAQALALLSRHHGLINCLAQRTNANGNPLTPNYLADHLGIRVVITSQNAKNDCYQLLHSLSDTLKQAAHLQPDDQPQFKINAHSFKDYISNPKANGYQSLHIGLLAKQRHSLTPIELQIRTAEMDQSANTGSAAHTQYKRTQKLLTEAFLTYFEQRDLL